MSILHRIFGTPQVKPTNPAMVLVTPDIAEGNQQATAEGWQNVALATLRDYLAMPYVLWRASHFIDKTKQVIEKAPAGTRADRLRVVMKERLDSDIDRVLGEVIPMAHERQRLQGPVDPDRNLTFDERRARYAEIASEAFDVIWDAITDDIQQLLAAQRAEESIELAPTGSRQRPRART